MTLVTYHFFDTTIIRQKIVFTYSHTEQTQQCKKQTLEAFTGNITVKKTLSRDASVR